jgi:hypothetical protein
MNRLSNRPGESKNRRQLLPTGWPRVTPLRITALIWAAAMIYHLRQETAHGLSSGQLAFGDDFINFWAAPRLALSGHIATVYHYAPYHEFQVATLGGPIGAYQYSYPPIAILLCLPFALLPYLWGLGAWLAGGWLVYLMTVRAAWPAAMRQPDDAVGYALAVPAVFLNAFTGQNGTWMAALFGGGLMAVNRRPLVGGALLGLLVIKPQLAFLVPMALLAGRRWLALMAFCGVAALLVGTSVLLFGLDTWWDFARQVAQLRQTILEDGTGVWHLFVSIFVTVRHLPAPVSVAYAVQAVAAIAALLAVVLAWRSSAPQTAKNAVLVMAVFYATPYVQAYDMVVTTLVPLWLVAQGTGAGVRPTTVWLASLPLIVAPVLSPFLSKISGFGVGCLLLAPAMVVAVYACARAARREQRAAIEAVTG